MIAALYVETGGSYFGLSGVDPWDEARDARRYAGPHPVVAHPPCQRWGKLWAGQPLFIKRTGIRKVKGDDKGCFKAALIAARQHGGIIEHPWQSHAWPHFDLTVPRRSGGWVKADNAGGWTCCVEQGRYGHYARHFPALFRFVTLQIVTSVRPDAAKKFNPVTQYDNRFGLIDLQPEAQARTKKRNAVIPAIRPMRVVLRAWQRDGYSPVDSNKTAWRKMRTVLELSSDVHAKTIRHTIATWLYSDPTVPERQVSEMLGHEGKLSRTTKRYAKYHHDRLVEAQAALTKIWMRISRLARRYGADHLLTTGQKGRRIIVKTTDQKG